MLKPYRELISPLGPAESVVMAVLWEADGPLTVKDIRLKARSADYDRAHTTVMTVCVRMAEKGLLQRQPHPTSHCNAYLYSPAVSRGTPGADSRATAGERRCG
jgi:predicted transcriptional regulator